MISRLASSSALAYWFKPSKRIEYVPTLPAVQAGEPMRVASLVKLDPSKRVEPPFSSICQQPTSVGSKTQVGIAVGVLVGVNVGVCVAVDVFVGVSVGVWVGVLVGVFVGVFVGVSVGVFVGTSVSVGVGDGVAVATGVSV